MLGEQMVRLLNVSSALILSSTILLSEEPSPEVEIPAEDLAKLQRLMSDAVAAMEKDMAPLQELAESMKDFANFTQTAGEGFYQMLQMAEKELSSMPPDQMTPQDKQDLADLRKQLKDIRKSLDENSTALQEMTTEDKIAPGAVSFPSAENSKKTDLSDIGGSITTPAEWTIPSGELTPSAVYEGLFGYEGSNTLRPQFVAVKTMPADEEQAVGLAISWTPRGDDLLGLEPEGTSLILLGKMGEARQNLETSVAGFSLVRPPSLIDAKGTGAWMEYKAPLQHNSSVSRRLYMLGGKDYILKVQLAINTGDEGLLKELWSAFSSLKYEK